MLYRMLPPALESFVLFHNISSVMNVLFYLDQRQAVLRISLFFALSNGVFSWASLQLHPMFIGYGLGLSVLLTSIVALATLWRKLQKLEYETFMLRPVHY